MSELIANLSDKMVTICDRQMKSVNLGKATMVII